MLRDDCCLVPDGRYRSLRPMPIDVKDAVGSATKYFTALVSASDVRLEEVEISDDDRLWLVTLSALIPVPKEPEPIGMQSNLSVLSSLFENATVRVYKVFAVDSATGTVRSMKMRQGM
jgi:hypothetical protein